MLRKKIIPFLTAACCAAQLVGTASAAEVESGSVYCFSPGDFSQETSITGICITDLPENSGSVMLGSRILRAGDILTADQVAQMTFAPIRSEEDFTAEVGYLPIYEDHVAAEQTLNIGIKGKEDLPPVAEDMAMETYKNLPGTGKLKVSDPEGQAMTFTLVRGPKRGEVAISEDGSFTYTPKKNKVGVDSFVFTATDPAGKVSREATVTITILKPSDAPQYTDTLGKDCQFAAEWMKHTGIFTGETVAQTSCFSPEKAVTRGEFVSMLVKALEIPTETEALPTGFTDEIPSWLAPYVAAAVRSGLTAGLQSQEVFGADKVISGAEASVMLQNALDLKVPAVLEGDDSTVPVWAQASLAALESEGIALKADAALTRGAAAQALYQASKLIKE